nr:MAG TPA: hypothetical protein [Caudoviricetes sp.]
MFKSSYALFVTPITVLFPYKSLSQILSPSITYCLKFSYIMFFAPFSSLFLV